MRLISYAGISFASLGITHAAIIRGLPGVNRTVDLLPRRDGEPVSVGATDAGRPIPGLFTVEGINDERVVEARLRRMLGRLNVQSPDARPLVCEIDVDTNDDGVIDAQVQVSVLAVCGAWKWVDGGMRAIELTFDAIESDWSRVSATTDGPDTINAGSLTASWPNPGDLAAAPVITRSNHSSFTTTNRYPVTVTNGSEFPLERETIIARMADLTSTGNAKDFTVLKDGSYLSGLNFGHNSGYVPFVQFPGGAPAGGSDLYYVLEKDTGITRPSYSRFDGNYTALDLEYVYVTATGGGANTFVVSGAGWATNRYQGACLVLISGTGAGQARFIGQNDGTTLSLPRAWITNPTAGTVGLIVTSGIFYDGGRASSGAASTLTDSAQAWQPDSLIGGTITTLAGTGSGQTRTITANTATMITVDPAWGVTPNNTTTYRIERPGYHRYHAYTNKHTGTHRGGWQQNARYTRPSKIAWGNDILNGWAPFLMQDNGDDFNQPRTTGVDVGGGDIDWFPNLNATRRRGQDRRLQEEGLADGVAIYHPLGYTSIQGPIAYTNQNTAPGASAGIGRIVLGVRGPGGDDFDYPTNIASLQATETASNLDASLVQYGYPNQLYMGVLPNDGVEISQDAGANDYANVRWYSVIALWVQIANRYSVTVGTPAACIEVNDEIRIGDYALQIGARDGQRLWMKASGQSLVLDCANARAWIEETGQDDIDVTYAVTPVVYDGSGNSRIADRWPVLEPGANTVTCSGTPWASAGQFELSVSFREGFSG